MISLMKSIILKKKFLIIFLIFVFKLNPLSAGPGVGDITLSEQVVRDFYNYIQQNRTQGDGNPVKFQVTEDGENSYSWVCPYSQCTPTGSMQEDKVCFETHFTKCYTLAIRRVIVWKNEETKKAKRYEKKFSRKDSYEEVEDKLRTLGLIY